MNAQEFEPAVEAENVEYKAFARHFEHEEADEPGRRAVLFVFATMSFPDSGWEVTLVPQAGEVDTWRLLADRPGFRDGDRTYYVACGSTEHEIDAVPKTVRVINGEEITRVSVVPWD
ncbi:MAG: hypothetical protein D6696_18730 [Acidobacteria bacterium]|nr:MAG: hypothetical protein D6696_18730 [Acidobacteriota bacterium]